jgi:protein SCO1
VSLDPLFNLTTQHGQRLTRADLKGRPFIVLFGYTSCADVCPTALSDLSVQLQKLGAEADRLRVVFVTVDPDRDTVAHLRSYLESFDGRIVGVTGSIGDIRQVAAALGAAFARGDAQESGYSVDHSYRMFLFDRYGLLTKTVGYKEQAALASLSRRLLAQ